MLLKIAGRVVASATNGMANSYLAADLIGAVTAKSALTNNGGQKFGVLGKTTISKVKITAPTFNWIAFGSPTQTSGDFMVKRF